MESKYPCPGHAGVCSICKKEDGAPRSIGGMPEIDRKTRQRKVDFCCHSCAKNMKRERRLYERTSIS